MKECTTRERTCVVLKCPYNTGDTSAQYAKIDMKDKKTAEWGTKYMLTVNDNALTSLLMKTGEILADASIEGFKTAMESGNAGNLHTHSYVVYKRSIRRDTLISRYKKWGVQVDRVTAGTEKTVIEYIGSMEKTAEKQSTLYPEYTCVWGDIQTTQGARNDTGETEKALWQIKEAIDAGTPLRQVWNDFFPYMVRHSRGVEAYYQIVAREKPSKGLRVAEGKDKEQIEAIRSQAALDRESAELESAELEKILLRRIYETGNSTTPPPVYDDEREFVVASNIFGAIDRERGLERAVRAMQQLKDRCKIEGETLTIKEVSQ